MNTDVKGVLAHLMAGKPACFEHNGKLMTRKEVLAVLEFANQSGFKSTDEIPDKVINEILKKSHEENKGTHKTV